LQWKAVPGRAVLARAVMEEAVAGQAKASAVGAILPEMRTIGGNRAKMTGEEESRQGGD